MKTSRRLGACSANRSYSCCATAASTRCPAFPFSTAVYQKPADKPTDLQILRRSGWHTDDSFFAVPAKITLLQGLAIPDSGGETRFCNARAAYEDLSAAMKTRVDGLRAVHGYDTPRAPGRAQERTKAEEGDTPDVEHPLIRTHDETGKQAIYFNSNRTDCIVGMDRGQSDALLDEIDAHMTQASLPVSTTGGGSVTSCCGITAVWRTRSTWTSPSSRNGYTSGCCCRGRSRPDGSAHHRLLRQRMRRVLARERQHRNTIGRGHFLALRISSPGPPRLRSG